MRVADIAPGLAFKYASNSGRVQIWTVWELHHASITFNVDRHLYGFSPGDNPDRCNITWQHMCELLVDGRLVKILDPQNAVSHLK